MQNYAPTEDVEVVALADPVARNRKAMPKRAGFPGAFDEYDDWREMLDARQDLDGVVITTPNYLHADPAVACYERNLPIVLEKPLATTQADCERILEAERANNGRTLLGFVLRSTPFYSRIHQIITDGAIGRVVSIQASELPGRNVTSVMNRGSWRRFRSMSGGLMLEKCSHDMDVFNWMTDSRPVSINSYGGRLIFNANPSLPLTCGECGVADQCKYYQAPDAAKGKEDDESILVKFLTERGRCIYNSDKDVFDTQSVNIEYENGTVVDFLLQLNCAGERCGREFHAMGDRGRVWGNAAKSVIYHHDNLNDAMAVHECELDGSTHGGGDRTHCLELRQMMADPDYRPAYGVYAGYLSAVMCFAADRSCMERRRVDFAYDDGRIELL